MYTVLACDDDLAILNSVEIYLRMEGYEALKAQTVMHDEKMNIFFEFAQTTVTIHFIVGDEAKSDTTNVQWVTKHGKLTCKNPAGQGEATATLVNENTLHWEKDSKEKGFILTRSSTAEREAVIQENKHR